MTCYCTGSIYPVLYLFVGLASAQTVTLTSSVEQNGRQAACPGEVVTFTCVVTEAGGLQWIAEPFIPQSGSGSIMFPPDAMVGTMIGSGQFRAVIVHAVPRPPFADLTSELIVTVSQTLDGTVIQCHNPTSKYTATKTLTLAAPPSSPQLLSSSVSEYHLNDFTVAVQWESPASDGGVGINNYTLTGAGITTPLTVLSNEPLMATLTLSYNEMQMVRITASNCAGESTASVQIIHKVGCGPPTPPLRGSLGDLISSQEGKVVTFQCNPGLVPSQQMMSVCAANGSWTPDPAGLVCRVDCGDPSPPRNGFVMAYDSTLEGSKIAFQCSPGFVSSQQMMSVCATNGSWTPDPAELECRADCGIPIIVNGSVNYTTTVEGSTATYQCGTGLIPGGVMTAMCTGNGEWAPDPADVGCRLPADCGIPVVISGSVNYTTTVEGSNATYQCDTGLIPKGVITAVCMGNGEWVPDPANTSCILPSDCGIPVIFNGCVNYTTTVEGSTATYQCDTGLIPGGVMTVLCMENGEWDPDPRCRLPGQADCGNPSTPLNGFVMAYNSTREHSWIVFQCSPGFVPSQQMMSVCAANGSWTPNPVDLVCREPGLSTAEVVGVTFVLSSIVSFTAGLLVALVIAYCYIQQLKSRYSPRDPQHPIPMYEEVSMVTSKDIELKENVAYGPVSR